MIPFLRPKEQVTEPNVAQNTDKMRRVAEDPYASMEKDQLISMIHFLVKREDEPTNEARIETNSIVIALEW